MLGVSGVCELAGAEAAAFGLLAFRGDDRTVFPFAICLFIDGGGAELCDTPEG